MNANDIRILFDYSYWAQARIMRLALLVTPEQFNAANSSSYGSLRGTLVHLLRAEMIWRRRLQGDLTTSDLPLEEAFSTPQELVDYWKTEEILMRAFLSELRDADLEKPFEYKNSKGDVFSNITWGILVQVVNHGTQHRAEAASMLTDFHHSPGDVDMILYLREKGL